MLACYPSDFGEREILFCAPGHRHPDKSVDLFLPESLREPARPSLAHRFAFVPAVATDAFTIVGYLLMIGCLATFYIAAVVAFENMYRRAGEERRNAFVIERNRTFRRFNVIANA